MLDKTAYLCICKNMRWFWQFSVNLPFDRFILEDVRKRDITDVVSPFPYPITIFIRFPASDDKDSSILKSQTKANDVGLELFSFLPNLRLKVKYKTCLPSK